MELDLRVSDEAVEALAAAGPEREAAIALALREAVTNVLRHAQARTCRVALSEVTGTSSGSPLSPSIPLSPRGARRTPPPDPRESSPEVTGTSSGSPLSPSIPLSPRGARRTPPPDPREPSPEVTGTSGKGGRIRLVVVDDGRGGGSPDGAGIEGMRAADRGPGRHRPPALRGRHPVDRRAARAAPRGGGGTRGRRGGSLRRAPHLPRARLSRLSPDPSGPARMIPMETTPATPAPVPDATDSVDVLVIGGAFSGALVRPAAPTPAAGRPDPGGGASEEFDRKVGEATVEISALFLHRLLGTSDYLARHQLPKHGLRFWFSDGADRSLDEMTEIGPAEVPRLPSFQLDRGGARRAPPRHRPGRGRRGAAPGEGRPRWSSAGRRAGSRSRSRTAGTVPVTAPLGGRRLRPPRLPRPPPAHPPPGRGAPDRGPLGALARRRRPRRPGGPGHRPPLAPPPAGGARRAASPPTTSAATAGGAG